MTDASDSFDDVFVAHFETRAVGLVEDATTDEPQHRRDACRWLGTMKYNAERGTRHNDNRTPDECSLYDASIATLRIVDAFIDHAAEDQLRFVLEGMLHALDIDSLLRNLREPHNPQVGQTNEADGDAEVVRSGSPTGSLPSATVMADVIADFTQTHDVETLVRAGVFVGIIKHQGAQSLRDPNNDDDHPHHAVEATQTLAAVDSLIAQADANRLRAIIAGFTREMHT